jgi:hypothetical protein
MNVFMLSDLVIGMALILAGLLWKTKPNAQGIFKNANRICLVLGVILLILGSTYF